MTALRAHGSAVSSDQGNRERCSRSVICPGTPAKSAETGRIHAVHCNGCAEAEKRAVAAEALLAEWLRLSGDTLWISAAPLAARTAAFLHPEPK